MQKTYRIRINGRVQGVGFRPFVFRLARCLGLVGVVFNDAKGVLIYVTGTPIEAHQFLQKIQKNKPKIATIEHSSIVEISAKLFPDFRIVTSEVTQNIDLPVTPDFAVCATCKSEMIQAKNRRLGYAFTSCVSCGPRYAVTTNYPFERYHTSLSNFKLCSSCSTEYSDPSNERFHSQINTCPHCGIRLRLVDKLGKTIGDVQSKIIDQTVELIKKGNIIAIKNMGGYLLCCDATNPMIIQRLRKRKQRPQKPFAVLFPTLQRIEEDFNISMAERKALISSVAPIVIVKNTSNTRIATQTIAPNLKQTGVMLPSSALLQLLMNKLQQPLVATSGNYHGSPIIASEQEADKSLIHIASYLLHHNLEIIFPQDDSVVRFSDERQLVLRRSRGLAPSNLEGKISTDQPVLSMGAELKSTFSYLPGQYVYTSQYLGNLQCYEVLQRYEQTVEKYFELFNKYPKVILTDANPQYQSSIYGNKLAMQNHLPIHKIQHHKAHFASVLGEHQLFESSEPILGVIWDGNGWGEDNQVWGGEFFIYQNQQMNRLMHFDYYHWIANDKFAQEPRLALLSLLDEKNDSSVLCREFFSDTEWSIYNNILSKNTLKTSSVGRLFDAVSCLLGLCTINSYEAQASMLLEDCASVYQGSEHIDFLENTTKLSPKYIIKKMIKAQQEGTSSEKLASSFIHTLAEAVIRISRQNKIKTIACSGGVFQNATLVSMLSKKANQENTKLKINCKLPVNDENISFGQMMYYYNCKN